MGESAGEVLLWTMRERGERWDARVGRSEDVDLAPGKLAVRVVDRRGRVGLLKRGGERGGRVERELDGRGEGEERGGGGQGSSEGCRVQAHPSALVRSAGCGTCEQSSRRCDERAKLAKTRNLSSGKGHEPGGCGAALQQKTSHSGQAETRSGLTRSRAADVGRRRVKVVVARPLPLSLLPLTAHTLQTTYPPIPATMAC